MKNNGRLNSVLSVHSLMSLVVFFSLIIFSDFSANAREFRVDIEQEPNDSVRDPKKYFLRIDAIVHDSKGPDKADNKVLQGVVIKILNEKNYLVASHFTDKKGKTSFELPLDQKFTLLITKKGYVTKIVEINTKVPKDVNAAYIFPVDVSIFEEVKDLNTAVLTKPIAKVQFNTMSRDFQYDIAYTHRINGELKKMYKEYYELKKAEEKN
jgi:hypothetical protein